MRRWLRWTAWIVVLLTILLGIAAFFFPQKFLCVDSGPVNADVMVVLGGGMRDRPERAAELFRAHAAPRVVISGVGDDRNYRRFLTASGVPSSVIQMEDQSRTTKENAVDVISLLRRQRVHRVIIVTSWYHSRRALACFEHYAPEMQFYSRPSNSGDHRADWRRQNLTRRIYLEYPKLIGYWMCYGVSPF